MAVDWRTNYHAAKRIEDIAPDADRLYHALTNVVNAAADRGIDPHDAMSGASLFVANMALQMPPNVRLLFFQMITEQGHRLEQARRAQLVVVGQS